MENTYDKMRIQKYKNLIKWLLGKLSKIVIRFLSDEKNKNRSNGRLFGKTEISWNCYLVFLVTWEVKIDRKNYQKHVAK